RYGIPFVLFSCGLAGMVLRGGPPTTVAWQDRSGLRNISQQLRGDLHDQLAQLPPSQVPQLDCLIYVLAEPGMYYHLSAATSPAAPSYIAQPAGGLSLLTSGQSDRRLPNLLVTGPHAHRDAPELLTQPPSQLELLAEYPYRPSDLVQLDDMCPDALANAADEAIRVWAIHFDR
ncbi:MAG: hypothetical protein KDA58_12230, partial [Planctomycetaceae bacterium]|nr:hypothetical protein [Planctomycetaceae bacterium]